MALPFEVPADLTTLTAEEFATYSGQVRTHATAVVADETLGPESVIEAQDTYAAMRAEETRRTELATAATDARAALAAGLAPGPAPVVEPTEVLPAVTAAAARPAPAVVETIEVPAEPERRSLVAITAAADSGSVGQELATFADAGPLLERRLASYGSSVTGGTPARPIPGHANKFVMGGRTLNRHGVVQFTRQLPEELQIRDTDAGRVRKVLEFAREQARLRGGSLLAAMTDAVERGVALTAAAGWCAPSETLYDLVSLETIDGILDLPTVQAMRGGFNIPENGGVDFSTIWDSIGDDGDVILTEYDVENSADKICVEIPCPDFEDVRLDVAYVCITGALLQQRGYPEAVTRFSEGAMVALAHKVNQSVIARIRAQSTNGGTIAAIANNTDGASQILSAVEIAAWDIRYKHRMSSDAVLEVVLPLWALGPIRAAMARRAGVAEVDVTDAQILGWFRTRNVAPRFVYDWQDALAGQVGGPGGASPIVAFPANVEFLIYPAGTWVKAERDVVQLDTVYDNALLTQNQFTAIFAEDGFNVLKMGPDSRYYTTPLNPAGVTGQPA